MHILKKIGWEILEYLRRALTPFVIKVMFGMTMFVLLLIENVQLRMVLMALLFACDCVLSFVLFRSAGEQAYKMKQAGILSREQRPVGSAGAQGVYRPCKEYRPYKGFVIAAVSCLVGIVLILVSALGNSLGARLALMLLYGWAYAPVASFYMIEAVSKVDVIPLSSVWFTFILFGVYLIVAGMGYILGGQKEKMRLFMLERSAQAVESGKSRRSLNDEGERKR